MFSNLPETLHSQTKFKNKQVAKIWIFLLKKQKFGATMHSPEGLVDTLLIQNMATDYIQKRRGEPGLFSLEYQNWCQSFTTKGRIKL